MADSAFSDCCIDYTTAAHIGAEAIVKVGSACSVEIGKACPTFVLPQVGPLSTDALIREVCRVQGQTQEEAGIVLVTDYFADPALEKWSGVRVVSFSEFYRDPIVGNVICVSDERWKVDLLALVVRNSTIFNWTGSCLEAVPVARLKSKRHSLLSSVSEGCAVGIIVHSSAKSFADLAFKLSRVLRDHGHPAFIFSVGRISPTKLGNFPDIRLWTILGCPRHLFSHEQFFADIISPFELLCALGVFDFWADKYSLDSLILTSALDGAARPEPDSPAESPSQVLAKMNFDYSTHALSVSSYRGIPMEFSEEVADAPTQILKGSSGIPREYKSVE